MCHNGSSDVKVQSKPIVSRHNTAARDGGGRWWVRPPATIKHSGGTLICSGLHAAVICPFAWAVRIDRFRFYPHGTAKMAEDVSGHVGNIIWERFWWKRWFLDCAFLVWGKYWLIQSGSLPGQAFTSFKCLHGHLVSFFKWLLFYASRLLLLLCKLMEIFEEASLKKEVHFLGKWQHHKTIEIPNPLHIVWLANYLHYFREEKQQQQIKHIQATSQLSGLYEDPICLPQAG